MGCLAALVQRCARSSFLSWTCKYCIFLENLPPIIRKPSADHCFRLKQFATIETNDLGTESLTELVSSMSYIDFRELIEKSPLVIKKTHVSESSTNFEPTVLCEKLCVSRILYHFFDAFRAEKSFLIFVTFLVLTF